MKKSAGPSSAERKKIIIAAALGALALLLVLRVFLSGPGGTPSGNNAARTGGTPPPARTPPNSGKSLEQLRNDDLRAQARPIVFDDRLSPAPLEAGRNIFAFYVPPPKPTPGPPIVPTPTPAPPPPQILASINPSNVYAGTGDFTIEVVGDKFTPDSRIMIGDQAVATRFINAQSLSGSVSGADISSEGARSVSVRTPDGRLFSNTTTLNVAAPPKAPYTFVALIGGPRYDDTAVLKEQGSSKLINVTRGQVVGDQWRVTSISDRELILSHVSIPIKQRLPFVEGARGGAPAGGPVGSPSAPRPAITRPPAPPQAEENEEN
ncbi:MAG TPA: hypothetical protein VM870_08015 [Pyrinomonadaceae bacterium]|jgi:hypothetical protein|nr:hypothetical protein [Pyrinomonadaceae bacterium]